MSAIQKQFRKDTATNLNAATPANGEPGWDTTNKRLVMGDGSTAGGVKIPSAKDVQNQAFTVATVGGTANAITLTHSPAWTSLVANQRTVFKATSDSSTGVTITVDGLTTKNAKYLLNNVLTAFDSTTILKSGIYYEALYNGTDFQVLGVSTTPPASGLVYLGTYTASTSAQIDITSKISATYDDYLIILGNVTTDNSGANLILQTSTDNGANFDSTSGDYFYATHLNTTGVGESTSNSTAATGIVVAPSVGTTVSGEIRIYNVNSTTQKKQVTSQLTFIAPGGSTRITSVICAGQRDSTANVDALRFLFSTANIASGTFKIYGISKA